MALRPGTRLGPYELVALIGSGGMGEVYKARDTKLHRGVALKVLPEAFTLDSDRLARFKREAQVLASLNHPNIAAIYGFEESSGMQALVLELVEGSTVADRIAKGPIPLDEAWAIARQIAEALEAAHDRGVIHRDLKPANVKITPSGQVKVLDFGLAKALDTAANPSDASHSPTITSPAITGMGVILGTAAYMSPEQARGKAVDKRTDIWAFGCVLYEMLTGRRAFEGEEVTDVLARILEREPDWTLLRPGVPPGIQKLLRLCLEKDVKKRRQSAGDLRIDVEQASTESPEAKVIQAPQPARSARLAWIVAVLFAAIAVITTILALRPVPDAPEMRVQITTPATASPLHFALSPDGRYLAFVARGDGAEQLWLRPLHVVEAQPMPGTDGAQYPFWSDDSRSLGFFAFGRLYRIDVAGGPPQSLADAADPRGATWNADGVILFAQTTGPLLRIAASGGKPVAITRLQPPLHSSHRFPQFLPDGHHFLFYAQGSADGAGIYLATLDGGEPKRLTAADTAGVYLEPARVMYVQQEALVVRRLDVERGELTSDPETLADPVSADSIITQGGFSAPMGGSPTGRREAPIGGS